MTTSHTNIMQCVATSFNRVVLPASCCCCSHTIGETVDFSRSHCELFCLCIASVTLLLIATREKTAFKRNGETNRNETIQLC